MKRAEQDLLRSSVKGVLLVGCWMSTTIARTAWVVAVRRVRRAGVTTVKKTRPVDRQVDALVVTPRLRLAGVRRHTGTGDILLRQRMVLLLLLTLVVVLLGAVRSSGERPRVLQQLVNAPAGPPLTSALARTAAFNSPWLHRLLLLLPPARVPLWGVSQRACLSRTRGTSRAPFIIPWLHCRLLVLLLILLLPPARVPRRGVSHLACL
jgi:hypothetical protein